MLKQRTLFALTAALLILTLALSGCSDNTAGSGDSGQDKRVGALSITSDGETYELEGMRVFELYSGGDVDDTWAPGHDEVENKPVIRCAPDFKATVTGGTTYEAPYFMEYIAESDSYKERDLNTMAPGSYKMVAAVDWGPDALEFVTYWYYIEMVIL